MFTTLINKDNHKPSNSQPKDDSILNYISKAKFLSIKLLILII